jgi:NTE family protein
MSSRPQTLGDWLSEEPFALGMSSGFFGFFAHCGMLAALEERGLAPVRVSGSSAGALVAGVWAAGRSATEISAELLAVERRDFWDPWPGAGLLRGQLFARQLERVLPVRSFGDCRVPLTVSTFDLLGWKTRVLDEGPLAPAIRASCSVPLLFQPVWIDRRPLWDGGVADRPGLAGMPHGQRVFFHHLASRSPWRRKQSNALQVPQRPDLTALVIHDLPRLGPFELERAPVAYAAARQATRCALDAPIRDRAVHVDASAAANA